MTERFLTTEQDSDGYFRWIEVDEQTGAIINRGKDLYDSEEDAFDAAHEEITPQQGSQS